MIVHGLPVVPESDERCQDKVNDLLLVGVVEAAGMSVFSYRQQVAGRLVQDVRPLPGRELTNSHAGRVPLGWHTDEAAFRPQYRAEGIALLCVNNAAGATTSYRDVGDVVAALERSALATLTERRFRFPVPESFSVFGGKLIYTEPRPVLSETAGIFEVASAGTSTIVAGRDDQAANALSAFRAAVAAANGDEVKLEDGDLLVFSNVRGLHARDAVNGSRFLKRAFFRASLQALREAGHSSPMENVFSCEDFVLD